MTKKPTIVHLNNTDGFDRFDDVFNEFRGDAITAMHILDGHEAAFLFKTASKMQLKLTFLREEMVQLSYTFRNAYAKEPLYALSADARICLNKKAIGFDLNVKTDADSYFFQTKKCSNFGQKIGKMCATILYPK